MNASQGDIEACQFANWYPAFRDVSIKSHIISLPPEFLDYLAEDGVFVPIASNLDKDQLDDDDSSNGNNAADKSSHDCDNDESESDSTDPRTKYQFPDVEEALAAAIREFNGQAFIKFNWSAPLDASWMNAGTMKCQSAHDALLLVKSSDRIIFDVERMFELIPHATITRPTHPTLVVRKWANLHPSMEFRIFVLDGKLIGICQRNCTTHFPFLAADMPRITKTLTQFFTSSVHSRALLPSYTMDVYLDQKNRVWIIDFNPWGAPTCPLLFSWEEFSTLSEMQARVVESEDEVLRSAMGMQRGPVDVHLSEDFPRFMEICKSQQQEEDADDGR